MDANQLIKALGDSAAASSASENYCLLWSDHWWWMCMNKAEWAAWTQAVGALVALAIAVALPYWQSHMEKRRNFALAKNCVLNLMATLYAIRSEGSKGDFPKAFLSCASTFSALEQSFQEVRISLLPSSALPTWSAVITQSLQLRDEIASIEASLKVNWTFHNWLQLVENNIEAANERLAKLSAHEPKLWKRAK